MDSVSHWVGHWCFSWSGGTVLLYLIRCDIDALCHRMWHLIYWHIAAYLVSCDSVYLVGCCIDADLVECDIINALSHLVEHGCFISSGATDAFSCLVRHWCSILSGVTFDLVGVTLMLHLQVWHLILLVWHRCFILPGVTFNLVRVTCHIDVLSRLVRRWCFMNHLVRRDIWFCSVWHGCFIWSGEALISSGVTLVLHLVRSDIWSCRVWHWCIILSGMTLNAMVWHLIWSGVSHRVWHGCFVWSGVTLILYISCGMDVLSPWVWHGWIVLWGVTMMLYLVGCDIDAPVYFQGQRVTGATEDYQNQHLVKWITALDHGVHPCRHLLSLTLKLLVIWLLQRFCSVTFAMQRSPLVLNL